MTSEIDCTGCKAPCCAAELVALVEGDNVADYPEAEKWNAEGRAYLKSLLPSSLGYVLPHVNRHCVYLKDGRCSIYEKRPRMCREFSCVGWVKRILETTTRQERRRDKEFIDTAVWREGKKRMSKGAA